MIKRNLLLWIASLLMVAGLWQVSQGAYLYAKAQFAQYLLRKSWDKTMAGAKAVKPWSWADTWPVARLEVPRLGIDQFVLDGASGRTMAFGPGHLRGTARPGEQGNTVFSGHRDTHFKFLQYLRLGDELIVTNQDGMRDRYRISDALIVDQNDMRVTVSADQQQLTLITCYPFTTVMPGASKRYVVVADFVAEPEATRPSRKRTLARIEPETGQRKDAESRLGIGSQP
ncbi:MAG: class GN sortase [Burkholderiales bacterium]